MLEVRTDEVIVDGRKMVISEANWCMTRKAHQLEDEIREHPSTAPLDFYMDNFYPFLFAFSSGAVPGREETLKMAIEHPQEFDSWFCAVRRLNPTKFKMNGHETDKDSTRELEFRDGSKITVISSHNHPSFVFKAQIIHDEVMQRYSGDELDIDPELFAFQSNFYPAMAACSTGDVPNVDEVDNWPETELAKWYLACREENPSLFPSVVTEAERATAEIEDASKKKSETKKRRRRSTPG